MSKAPPLDADTLALLAWCQQVEQQLMARGATEREAQQHIEEQADWYIALFYDGYTPEQAAAEAMH